MAANVFTYYEPVPSLWSEDSQRKLIDVWARSWRKAGWNPRVLTEQDARKHPRYAEFKRKFWSLPTEYGHDYEGACFLRWAAASAAGGGMLTDYDVINYHFAPQAPDPAKMLVYADTPPVAIFLGAVLAPYELFEGMCQEFFTWEPSDHDLNRKIGRHHCSDLMCIQRMFHTDNWPKPAWLQRAPGCALFDEPSWKTAPMVHYGYQMRRTGHWPKHEWIEKLRPF